MFQCFLTLGAYTTATALEELLRSIDIMVDLEPWGHHNDAKVRYKLDTDDIRQMGLSLRQHSVHKPSLKQPQDYQQLHMELLHASRKAARFARWLARMIIAIQGMA